MNFTERRAQFMKLWISMRCDLPPEIQTTYELFLSYENLKISLKLVHKKRYFNLSLLNIIILNFSKNFCMKQDRDAPPPPTHCYPKKDRSMYQTTYTFSFVTSFSATWESSGTSSLKNKTCKKKKKKKRNKISSESYLWLCKGWDKKHCLS